MDILNVPWIGMDKNSAVAISFCRIDIKLGHFIHMKAALPVTHLVPLLIKTVGGMHLAEGLHGQEKDQLKGGHLAADRLAF